MAQILDFEKPVAALDAEIAAMPAEPARAAARQQAEAKRDKLLADIYGRLTPWQKAQVARHPDRPRFLRIANQIFDEDETHG